MRDQKVGDAIRKWDNYIGFLKGKDAAWDCVSKRSKQALEEKDYKTFDALMTVLQYMIEIKNPYS